MFANQRFGEVCCHNMQTILHALSLLVVARRVTVININYELQISRPEQNTALIAKTEQFMTAKKRQRVIQGSRKHSVLRQHNSRLQTYEAAY